MNEWIQNAVVYQVYPKSFQDSNGDGIGDLRGIIDRLDYIKDLGCDVIWLNPIYRHSGVDGGYDISDYRSIAPELGTMEDFDALLEQAHARGLRIVMDLVVNHTSTEHPWFLRSKSSRTNDKRDFYLWRPPFKGHEPNREQSYFSGSAWKLDETTGEYYLHMFAPEQADLNWRNPRVREAVYEMMRWWFDKGVDGFRMDAINMIDKPDAVLQSDGGPDRDVRNGPNVVPYLREMNREVLSRYDVLTVGEMGNVTPQNALAYAPLDGSVLSMIFQFQHMDVDASADTQGPGKWAVQPLDLLQLKRVFASWQSGLHGRAWNSLYWCNHDQPRIVSRFGCDADEESRVRSAKMLAVCLHMMQGTPFVYQGEELGMTNYPFASLSECRDVETIRAYHEQVDEMHRVTPAQMMDAIRRKSRDNARTPMQWSSHEHAGFTTATPWMPVNPNHTTINAESQVSDPDSVFRFYKRLIALRKSLAVVRDGDFTLLMPEDPHVFAYLRDDAKTKILVACNFSNKTQALRGAAGAKGEKLLCNYTSPGATDALRPWEARILRL